MNNWKEIAAAAIVTHEAPAAAAPTGTTDAMLATALRQRINLNEIAPRDLSFAQSLLRGFDRYSSFTDRQRPHVERLVMADKAPESPDKALGEALEAALPLISARDHGFALSLLNGFKRYGSFTDRQRPHVERLLGTAQKMPAPAPAIGEGFYPNICATVGLDRFARFQVGELSLHLKNDGTLIWVKWGGRIVGSIDPTTQALRTTRRYATQYAIDKAKVALDRVETDPLAAARENGVLTGRCSCCGRPLTDPTSIEFGIGPICRSRGWGIEL